jgi:hypothetical protein
MKKKKRKITDAIAIELRHVHVEENEVKGFAGFHDVASSYRRIPSDMVPASGFPLCQYE